MRLSKGNTVLIAMLLPLVSGGVVGGMKGQINVALFGSYQVSWFPGSWLLIPLTGIAFGLALSLQLLRWRLKRE